MIASVILCSPGHERLRRLARGPRFGTFFLCFQEFKGAGGGGGAKDVSQLLGYTSNNITAIFSAHAPGSHMWARDGLWPD